MQKELIGNRELIETMRKMAIESGLSENVLDEFLEECASEFGSVGLLRNLAGAGFDLELAINSYEYMRKRRPISDFLPDLFTEDDKVLSIGCGSGVAEVNLALAGFQVWGVDTNKSGVDIARKLAEEIGLSQDCRFMEVSGYEYPFEDSFLASYCTPTPFMRLTNKGPHSKRVTDC